MSPDTEKLVPPHKQVSPKKRLWSGASLSVSSRMSGAVVGKARTPWRHRGGGSKTSIAIARSRSESRVDARIKVRGFRQPRNPSEYTAEELAEVRSTAELAGAGTSTT